MGGDHAGFVFKNDLAKVVHDAGFEVLDLGAHEYDENDDYPDFAFAVAGAVASGRADRGIVICGSGVGASVAANKVPGARASLCHDTYSARQGVEHDDMNVLCLGARVIGFALAHDIIKSYLSAEFTGEERHQRRLNKVMAADNQRRPADSPAS